MAQREVLIVAHDHHVGRVLNELFLVGGYQCLVAGSGREGLEAFRRSRPPLIVTDVNLPLMSGGQRVARAGIKLFQKIRQEDPDVAVITMSAGLDTRDAVESVKAGADAYLMKPVLVEELLITADRALERRQLLIERRQYEQDYGPPGVAEARRDVLIVDDDRQIREALDVVFQAAGYTCRKAPDGRAGLEEYRAWKPPLVVTGLKMPEMSGTELVQQVRREDPDAAAIVSSGNCTAAIVIESLKAGADAFLLKPVNVEELLITADRALERRQLLIERRRYRELLGDTDGGA